MKLFLGLDVGSMSTEAVLVNEEGVVLGQSMTLTGSRSVVAAETALLHCLAGAGVERESIVRCVATGYGRVSVPFADRRITEISCHGAGAFALFPNTRTVIDIGGQDSKVIRMDKSGKVIDFAMNDKCAAGTGRFLEVMADKLDVPLDKMGALALEARREVPISSVCTVFAESEVVSLLAQDHPKEEIVKGLHRSIVNRTWAMIRSVGIEDAVTMTGGVAKNQGVVKLLQDKLGRPIQVNEEPQMVGALGAALLAREA